MAFPLHSTGLINSIAFGTYSTALEVLSGSRHSDPGQSRPASAAHIFTAGSFAGLMQVRPCRLGLDAETTGHQLL